VVGQGNGVLDGGRRAARERGRVSGGFGKFLPYWFERRTVKQKCIRFVCKKLTVFPYGQYIVGNVFSLAF